MFQNTKIDNNSNNKKTDINRKSNIKTNNENKC